jgi:hypothetical protein
MLALGIPHWGGKFGIFIAAAFSAKSALAGRQGVGL